MDSDCKNPIVGIATVIGAVVLALGFLAMILFPDTLDAVLKITGYLVVLGIVLGFFLYALEREAMEKDERTKAALARKRK